jgi:transketolase
MLVIDSRHPAFSVFDTLRAMSDAAAQILATKIRRTILTQSNRAHVGHIGSCLSIVDILAVLYGGVLRFAPLDDGDRDRLVLSKGHAALALYGALNAVGVIDDDLLGTFCSDCSSLGTHPEHAVPGIDFSTGSLGHGLSFGCGAALAARMQGSGRRTFVIVSDAECNEGALWESVMFAAHHRLSNLTAIVDVNGQQAMGYTRDVLDLAPLEDKWRAFGWDVRVADGHDHAALESALSEPDRSDAPHVLVAATTFGKGVSFMENELSWHYWPMTEDQFLAAISELEVQEA